MSVTSAEMILDVTNVLMTDLYPLLVPVLRHVKMISMQMIIPVYVPIVIQHVQHALEIKVPTAANALKGISNPLNLQLLV